MLRGERVTDYIAPVGAPVGVCALCKEAAEDAGWVPMALAGARTGASPRRRRGLGLRQRMARVSEAARGLADRSARKGEAGDGGREAASPKPPGSPQRPPSRPPARERTLRRCVEAFNASGEPRKVAGLIRSLGEPQVTVRRSSGGGAVLTVAWELSWYQWEVSGDENGGGIRESGKGSEVGELDERDRRWNASVAADGSVAIDVEAARSGSSQDPAESA